jgi:aspartate kinase
MKIIVQKFGGTSLADSINRSRVVNKILEKYKRGYSIVVVVSAIGRKGDPYATDSLIDLVNKVTIKKRELDLLMSCGEIISAVILSSLVNEKGYESIVFTGPQAGIHTTDEYGNADIVSINPERILKSLKENKIVIVAGFQGKAENGDITTLGRGGSDTTAVALGESLNCECVEIYTDVDGIMTADPRLVPEAKLIQTICYNEVYQLAEDGAKVIHPKAIEFAERSNIKVIIKNTLKDNIGGTIITNSNMINKERSKNINVEDKLITAITYKKNRAQVIIDTKTNPQITEVLMKELTNNKISIDLINFFVNQKIFTVDEGDVPILRNILNKYDCNFEIIEKCCKISAIGHRIRGIPGVMSRIVNALSNNNIDILQTADSHTTIWCLIKEKDTEAAVKALHKEFSLDS